MEINVLGANYLIRAPEEKDKMKLENASGLCETYSKQIVIDVPDGDPRDYDNINEYRKKVLRHELVHAFLHESGLDSNSDWAGNEEVVDWIALQAPKLIKAFEDAQAL